MEFLLAVHKQCSSHLTFVWAYLLQGVSRCGQITPVLWDLHRLAVGWQPDFNMLVLTFSASCGLGPTCPRHRLPPHTAVAVSRGSPTGAPMIWKRGNVWQKGFRIYFTPAPFFLKNSPNPLTFRIHHKAHLCSQACRVWGGRQRWNECREGEDLWLERYFFSFFFFLLTEGEMVDTMFICAL